MDRAYGLFPANANHGPGTVDWSMTSKERILAAAAIGRACRTVDDQAALDRWIAEDESQVDAPWYWLRGVAQDAAAQQNWTMLARVCWFPSF